MINFIMMLLIQVMLVSCGHSDGNKLMVPRVPHHVVAEIEQELPVVVSQGGHVTQEGQKIPFLGFKTTRTIHNSEELLDLYKEVYSRLALAMSHDEASGSWEDRLFIDKQPKVWVGFSNRGDTEMFASRPSIALISMGPGGTLGLSFWNSESQRLVREDETSLRELFAEELASDKEK